VTNPRILIFSFRNIDPKTLFRCAHHEFENTISQMDAVELFAPEVDQFGARHQVALRVAFHVPVALNPGIQPSSPKGKYDLFLAICGSPRDLLMVNAVSNWREVCKKSVCLMDELWVKEMDEYPHFLRLLKDFDIIMLYYSQSVKPLSERIGRSCTFLPVGVDTISFCPYPQLPKRVVDVYSIGRRSEITHRALLRMVEEEGLFYLHDSIAGDQAIDSTQHRALFRNLAKRSRYFIVNPGLIDRPEKRGNQIEIGNRYYEGAASGTIMIGERPDNREFERLFGWPEALVHVPYGSDEINAVIKELDDQPERQKMIRRSNVAQSLLRHDYAYRWETMLASAGLEPMPALIQRKQRLQDIADAVLNSKLM